MRLPPTRRTALGFLASAAAGGALPLARTSAAAAQPGPPPFGAAQATVGAVPGPLRIGRVVVDASALITRVNVFTADLVKHDLAGDLKIVFADRMGGAGGQGTTLLVRVDSLFLPPWSGGRAGGNGGEGPDNIEGVGIVTAGGRVLSQTPLYTTLDPSYSGAWYQPGIDEIRISSICYQFAYWLRREMGV